MHNLTTKPTTTQTKIESKSVEIIYIGVDGEHVNLKPSKNINMKLVTVYTKR